MKNELNRINIWSKTGQILIKMRFEFVRIFPKFAQNVVKMLSKIHSSLKILSKSNKSLKNSRQTRRTRDNRAIFHLINPHHCHSGLHNYVNIGHRCDLLYASKPLEKYGQNGSISGFRNGYRL